MTKSAEAEIKEQILQVAQMFANEGRESFTSGDVVKALANLDTRGVTTHLVGRFLAKDHADAFEYRHGRFYPIPNEPEPSSFSGRKEASVALEQIVQFAPSREVQLPGAIRGRTLRTVSLVVFQDLGTNVVRVELSPTSEEKDLFELPLFGDYKFLLAGKLPEDWRDAAVYPTIKYPFLAITEMRNGRAIRTIYRLPTGLCLAVKLNS